MNNLDLAMKVKKTIVEQIGINLNRIKDDSNLEYLGIDSLDTLEIIMSLEEYYGISVPDEDIDGLKTVNDIIVLTSNIINK